MQKFCITCQAPHSGTSLECEKCSPTRPVESIGIPETSREPGAIPANPPVTPKPFAVPAIADGRRKMGILLGVGIFFLPWVFAWLTLRKGHSKPAKVISFAWLAFLTIGMIVSPEDKQSPQTSTPIAPEIEISEGTPIKNPVDLCSMPSRISKDPEISKLGGGQWKKWTAGGDYFGCEGGKDMITLDTDSSALAEFSVLGTKENQYAYVSVEYGATLYGTDQPSEKAARQRYITFLDQISVEMFGEKLPEDLKANILSDPKRSQPGQPMILHRALPKGYVELKLSNLGQGNISLIMFDLQFFEDADAYERFKDL